MSSQPQIALYNQVHGSDEGFVAAFVARLDVLETLVGYLGVIVETGTTNHYMLVGPRGMGKSSLLRRLGIAIAQTDTLNAHFMPLRFREEQYNVTSLAAFWGNCGEALADWAEQNDLHDLAAEMDSAIASPDWKDAAMAERQFRTACSKAGNRRPVLLVDNLDLIVDGIKTNEQWALRSALQSDGGPILIGAATQFLAQAADREAPFYEFFYPIVLEPLSETEMLACLRALAGARPDTSSPVLTILNQQPERLRTLYTLTGGNPRVLALIYLLLERAETETIFQDLEVLLDQVTPYYKSRVEEYQTAQQRAVIDAIALHWDPILSRGIAEATGIAPTTISGLLLKLRREGFIQEVQTSGAIAGYQISERFLNIWYLMRHGTRRTKLRLKWLSVTLASLYSASELHSMAQLARTVDGNCLWHPYFSEAVIEADAIKKSNPASGLGNLDEYEATLTALLDRASELDELGRWEEELHVYDDIVARFGALDEPVLQSHVAIALFNKGITLGLLGQREDAIIVYDEIIARLGAYTEPTLQELLGDALLNKSSMLRQLSQNENAIIVYDEIVARFNEADEPGLHEILAKTLIDKGSALRRMGRSEEAILEYDTVTERFGKFTEPNLQEQVAIALLNKAITFGQLGRNENAILIFDEVVSRFSQSTEPMLRETEVAFALVGKGIALNELSRNEDAIHVFDEVVLRFGTSPSVKCHPILTMALYIKGRDSIDVFSNLSMAAVTLQQAIELAPADVRVISYLAWVHAFQGEAKEAGSLLNRLQDLPRFGLNLLKAGIEIARDNLGSALTLLQTVLDEGFDNESEDYNFFTDLLWLLRLCEQRGYGQRVLDWLAETGFADKYAPLTVAFNAYVKGERFLLDSNPEVRGAAKTLYDRMDRHRKYKAKLALKEGGSAVSLSEPKPKRK